MPITLSQIASNTASVSTLYGEDEIHITYYPGRVTEKVFAELQSFSAMTGETIIEGFHTFNEMLAHLLKAWDVFEDDEQTIMFPIDADRLAELPIPFRMQVLNAVMSDIRPEQIAPTGPTQN